MPRPRIYKSNTDRQIAYQKRHPDLIRERSREYYRKNIEKIRDRISKYSRLESTRAKRSVYAARRRTGQKVDHRKLVSTFIDMINESIYCPLCGVEMGEFGKYPDGKSIDHILPVSLGGNSDAGNIRITCLACNIRRPRKL